MTDNAAIYAIVNHRHDGHPLVVGQFRDPQIAITAAQILADRGVDVSVELLTNTEAAE
jgi:hypothetical protein